VTLWIVETAGNCAHRFLM